MVSGQQARICATLEIGACGVLGYTPMSPVERAQVPGTTARTALVVRLCNWVGEVVLSLPALQRLAAAGYDLHLVGKRWAPALLEGSGWPVDARAPGLL